MNSNIKVFNREKSSNMIPTKNTIQISDQISLKLIDSDATTTAITPERKLFLANS